MLKDLLQIIQSGRQSPDQWEASFRTAKPCLTCGKSFLSIESTSLVPSSPQARQVLPTWKSSWTWVSTHCSISTQRWSCPRSYFTVSRLGFRDRGRKGSDWDFDSESVDDVLLLLPEAHWTFLLGFSLSGLGDVQEVGLEDSMEGLVWAELGKIASRSRKAREWGARAKGEASREERKAGRGRAKASGGGGGQRSTGLCLVLGIPGSWLQAASKWHSRAVPRPPFLQLLQNRDINCTRTKVKRVPCLGGGRGPWVLRGAGLYPESHSPERPQQPLSWD